MNIFVTVIPADISIDSTYKARNLYEEFISDNGKYKDIEYFVGQVEENSIENFSTLASSHLKRTQSGRPSLFTYNIDKNCSYASYVDTKKGERFNDSLRAAIIDDLNEIFDVKRIRHEV